VQALITPIDAPDQVGGGRLDVGQKSLDAQPPDLRCDARIEPRLRLRSPSVVARRGLPACSSSWRRDGPPAFLDHARLPIPAMVPCALRSPKSTARSSTVSPIVGPAPTPHAQKEHNHASEL